MLCSNDHPARRDSWLCRHGLAAIAALLVIAAPPCATAQIAVDSFDGSQIDLARWKVSTPLGGSTVAQSGALFLTSDGTPGSYCFTPGTFGPGAGLALRNKLAGDFDIEVEFRDFAGPYQDHVQAFFQVYQDADNQLHIKRMRFGTGDARQTVAKVAGVFPIQSGTVIPSIDSGTLRIVRAGAQITTFFNGLQDFSISAFSGAVIVQLTLVGPAGSSVTFDNFQVHSGTLLDPSLMCPDDNHPPVITCHGPVILWSPDHELIDASSAFSVDDPDGDPVDISIRVFSDETEIPDTGDGTGRHAPDFKTALDSGAAGLFLRSERRGGEDGRFYLGLITADDGMGGVTEQVCILAVCPHDQTDPASLDAVLSQAAAAAGAFDFPTGLSEHGLSAPLGPHQ